MPGTSFISIVDLTASVNAASGSLALLALVSSSCPTLIDGNVLPLAIFVKPESILAIMKTFEECSGPLTLFGANSPFDKHPLG